MLLRSDEWRLSAIFGVRDEEEARHLSIDYKQAAKLVGVAVAFLKSLYLICVYELALYKLIEVGDVVVPVDRQLALAYEQLAYGQLGLGDGEDGEVRESPFAYLIGCFAQGFGYYHKVFGDGTEVFAIKFRTVFHRFSFWVGA